MKQRLLCMLVLMFVTVPLLALAKNPGFMKKAMLLDRVIYNVQVEQWASTDTAKVIVRVNATLNADQLAKAHDNIMTNLKKIADQTEWHITSYNRRKSQSGLEQLNVIAQARLAKNQLPPLRRKAKAVSKSGETYRIQDIRFTPSLAEIEKVRNALREKVYNQVKGEIAALNRVYPEQHYYLHNVNFLGPQVMPQQKFRTAAMMSAADVGSASGLQVSQKIVVQAKVVVASMPEVIKKRGRQNASL